MRKIIPFLLLGLLLAACGGGGAVVARVDDAEITLSELETLARTASVPVTAGAEGGVSLVGLLQDVIIDTVVVREANEAFGISATDEEIDARAGEIQSGVEANGQDFQALLEEQNISEERVRRIARQGVIADKVRDRLVADAGPLTDEDVTEAYATQELSLTEACLSHILVAGEEEALAAKARLDAGEDFATVAKELSTDPSAQENSGDLGCGPLSTYVPEFGQGALAAEIGTVTDPVRSQFGYHLILVTSRETQPLDEVREQLVAQLESDRASELLRDWLLAALGAATIEIEPEYGQWSADPPQVLPPQE